MKATLKRVMLRVRDIKPDPANPRKKLTGISPLAASIRAVGLQVPLRVEREKGGGFHVIDGSRRIAAYYRNGAEDEYVPCDYAEDGAPGELRADASSATQLAKLMPELKELLLRLAVHGGGGVIKWGRYDKAISIRTLLDAGLSLELIAATAGTSTENVMRCSAALDDLTQWHYGQRHFGCFYEARVHRVTARVIDLLIRTGQLTSSLEVRKIPVIMTVSKQPWKSKKTLLELWSEALGRRRAA